MSTRCPTALVTGCGRRRVGHFIAEHLARLGYNIAVHYNQSSESAESNAQQYRKQGVEAATMQADIANEVDVQRLVDDVRNQFDSIDVLVNTASIWRPIPLEELSAEAVLQSFRVNTLGTFLCCQKVGLAMTEQPEGGNIVTIGDSLVGHPYVDYAAYFTAKGAIATLTKSFAVELGTRNPKVRVNCLAPGPVLFPEDMSEKNAKRVTASTLTQLANDPQSLVAAVEFLLNSPMMTGAVIPVDGGRNVGREQQARAGLPQTP